MILVREPNSTIDQAALIYRVIEACRNVIAHHETHLCDLDRAIGDGDHGTNMRRGLEALAAESRQLTAMPVSEAMIAVGTVLVMSIGGAAGPLYGTLLLEIGKGVAGKISRCLSTVGRGCRAAGKIVARRENHARCPLPC
jgi:dihydroxyacetone kinase-like protein